jgi:hypothetical protein
MAANEADAGKIAASVQTMDGVEVVITRTFAEER